MNPDAQTRSDLTVPHPTPEPAASCGQRTLRDGENGEPISILLVDDDPDCRLLVRDAIGACRVSNEVHEAADGLEALRLLEDSDGVSGQTRRPGLIYLDVEMPHLDGLETLRRIRADERFAGIPVVMMTGVADEGHMRRAAELGANSYTLKPANAEQFLRTVLASTEYWLNIHQYPERHHPPAWCRRQSPAPLAASAPQAAPAPRAAFGKGPIAPPADAS